MLLSVIVPMFNVSKYLTSMKKSIESTLNGNIEFILIDDGSKDDTFSKCKEIFKDKSNVKVYKNENHGVSFTRNYGVNMASGDYIMFWDADDLLNENWDKCVIDGIKENNDSDIIIFTNRIDCCYPEKKDLIESMIGVSCKYNNYYLAGPWSKIFKKKFIKVNGIKFNEEIINGEDLLFNIEAILLSQNCKIINESFYLYYINMNSATHKFDSRFLYSNEKYIEKLGELLEKYFDSKNDFIFKCISYSFVNSLYIFAGRLSKVKKYNEAETIIKTFYYNEFYIKNMKKYDANCVKSFRIKLMYFFIKTKLLYIIEFCLINFRKKRKKNDRYVLI